MTLDKLLKLFRRLIAESDLVLSNWTDEELLEFIEDAQQDLGDRGIANLDTYTVVSDPLLAGYGVSPEVSISQGRLLATKAAILLLGSVYRGKLSRGELGVSWQSGVEQESTISATKAWTETIESLENDLQVLVIIYMVASTGARLQ